MLVQKELPYNLYMSHLDILLPFALPPKAMASDLLRALDTSSLAWLLARSKLSRDEQFDPFARALPHEQWLARQFGLQEGTETRGSPPIATTMMAEYGLAAEQGFWFLLNPVRLHVARDHLVLTSRRQLNLSDQEARALYDAIAPLFSEIAKPLRYGDAQHWFMQADDWKELHTATPDAATGHNIDIWMPQGAAARTWRKLQNEIQMHWHIHPVNQARTDRGEEPVNSVWLWGGASASTDQPASRYSDLFNLPDWTGAFYATANGRSGSKSAADIVNTSPGHGLTVLDQLVEPALADDWPEWIARLNSLEIHWFGPILNAIKTGKISTVSLVLTHDTGLAEFHASRHSLRKFWVKPSLSRLIR